MLIRSCSKSYRMARLKLIGEETEKNSRWEGKSEDRYIARYTGFVLAADPKTQNQWRTSSGGREIMKNHTATGKTFHCPLSVSNQIFKLPIYLAPY